MLGSNPTITRRRHWQTRGQRGTTMNDRVSFLIQERGSWPIPVSASSPLMSKHVAWDDMVLTPLGLAPASGTYNAPPTLACKCEVEMVLIFCFLHSCGMPVMPCHTPFSREREGWFLVFLRITAVSQRRPWLPLHVSFNCYWYSLKCVYYTQKPE